MRRARSNSPSNPTPLIQSLDRGLLILESVAKSTHPVSVTELTDLLAVDHSSAFRLANTLKRRGFLACPPDAKSYILGPSMWRLVQRYDWSKMLVRIAHSALKLLARQTGETSHLAVQEREQALFVDHVVSNHAISVSGQTGELVPLYCTAHGKALLADFSSAQLRALFGAGPLKAYTPQTVASIDELAEICAQVRSQGFATDDGEYHEGLRCVAAPIRDRVGVVIGSIGISAPATRLPDQLCITRGRQAVRVAQEIQDLLGEPDVAASAASA
jgi:IclR family acetate operon transcriptional repressor